MIFTLHYSMFVHRILAHEEISGAVKGIFGSNFAHISGAPAEFRYFFVL